METGIMLDKVFVQFFAPQENPDGTQNGSETLSTVYLNEGLIASLSATSTFFGAAGTTVALTFKNPQGIFNPDKHIVQKSIFGDDFQDYRNLMVPDAKFFIAKGTYTDFWATTDAGRDSRLIGVFYADDVDFDLLGQTLSIKGEDGMKYLKMSAYVNDEPTIQRFPLPLKVWPYSAMCVGDIVHHLLEKFGVWHYHPVTEVIAKDAAGTLFTDHNNGFYKTSMSFKRGAADNEYNVLDIKTIYDYIVSLATYTNYRFFCGSKFLDGDTIPRPVFYFLPGEPTAANNVPSLGNAEDNTFRLLGTSPLLGHITAIKQYHEPSDTHERPIVITNLKYTLSDNDVRSGVVVHIGSETARIKNTGDSYNRMRFRKYRIGYVKDDGISTDTAWSKGDATRIAASLMWQSLHSYRKFEASFTNWVKFSGLSYNFDIDYTGNINPLNVQIGGHYFCDEATLTWNGMFTTSGKFWFLESVATVVEPLVLDFVDDVSDYATGATRTSIAFSNMGGSPYTVKYSLNKGTLTNANVTMDADNPIGTYDLDTHIGDTLSVQVFGGGQQSDLISHVVSGMTLGGGGRVTTMTV